MPGAEVTAGRADERQANFSAFYDAHYAGVVRQVYVVTGSRSEAEDIAQEAFVRAWPRWEQLSRYDDPRAWVVTVAHRVAVSRWRRSRTALLHLRKQRVEDVDPPSAETVALTAALRQLPEAQRRAVVLHHLGGLSVAEVARAEDVPEGTVKARLSRGRAALAGLLADEPADAHRPSPTPDLTTSTDRETPRA